MFIICFVMISANRVDYISVLAPEMLQDAPAGNDDLETTADVMARTMPV